MRRTAIGGIYVLEFTHFHARFIGALTHPVSFDPGS